jgi:hypothetical protein
MKQVSMDDRVLRLEQNQQLWEGILKPTERRPMSVPSRAAVKRWAERRTT